MTSRSCGPRPSWSASAAMPFASLPTASRPPSARLCTSSRALLTSIPITRSIPCPHLVYGLAPTNRSGSEERRGGIMLRSGLQARGSFRSPTPRAHPVHGVGAPPQCHIPARQGSFGPRVPPHAARGGSRVHATARARVDGRQLREERRLEMGEFGGILLREHHVLR